MSTTQESRKILVVEDEPDVMTCLEMLLRDAGFATVSARDGREGMEAVRREKPDLVTLDIAMPEASGVRFYKEIKTDPETAAIPVVIITGVTGHTGDPYAYKRLFSGRKTVPPPEGFLPKSVEKEEFLETVRKLLG